MIKMLRIGGALAGWCYIQVLLHHGMYSTGCTGWLELYSGPAASRYI